MCGVLVFCLVECVCACVLWLGVLSGFVCLLLCFFVVLFFVRFCLSLSVCPPRFICLSSCCFLFGLSARSLVVLSSASRCPLCCPLLLCLVVVGVWVVCCGRCGSALLSLPDCCSAAVKLVSSTAIRHIRGLHAHHHPVSHWIDRPLPRFVPFTGLSFDPAAACAITISWC